MDSRQGRTPDDSARFTKLFNEKYVALVRYAKKYLGNTDEAFEIAKDSFVKLWVRMPDFDDDSKMMPFLYITTRNACLNQLHKWKTHSRYVKFESGSAHIDPNDLTEDQQLQLYIELLFSLTPHLEPRCRKVIELRLAGMSHDEIAKELKIEIQNVRTQISKGQRHLRAMLKDSHLRNSLYLVAFIQYL